MTGEWNLAACHFHGICRGWRRGVDEARRFEVTETAGFACAARLGDRFVGVHGRLRKDPRPDAPAADRCAALLELYDRQGPGFLRDLDGTFNLVLWDGPAEKLLLYQDPQPGFTLLYVTERDGDLHFASALRPLLRDAFAGRPPVDRPAVYEFLLRSYLSAPKTGFRGVDQLRPGELVTWSPAGRHSEILDGWRLPATKRADREACLAEYRRLLVDSVTRACRHPDRTVFLLSGGYDSSVNVALAREIGVDPLHTVGITSERFSTDAAYSRQIAGICGTQHHEYAFTGREIEDLPQLVWAMEEPLFEPGMMLTYFALSIASRHGRTIVGGEGTDQLFANAPDKTEARYLAARRPLGYRFRRRLADLALEVPGLAHNSFLRKVENRLLGRHNVNAWSGTFGFRACDLAGLLRRGWHGRDRYDDLTAPDHDLAALRDFACVPVSRDYALGGILPVYGKLRGLMEIDPLSTYLDGDIRRLVLSLDGSLRTPRRPDGTYGAKRLHVDLAETLFDPVVFDRPKQGGAINPWIHLEDDGFRRRVLRHLDASPFLAEVFRPGLTRFLEQDAAGNATRTCMVLALDLWHRHVVDGVRAEPPGETLSEMLPA